MLKVTFSTASSLLPMTGASLYTRQRESCVSH